MAKLETYYSKIEHDLRWCAEDNGGVIRQEDLRRIIVERIGIDPRTYRNVSDALMLTGKLKPLNQYAFLFVDGGGVKHRASKGAAEEEADP